MQIHIDHINIRSSKELLEQVKDFYCNVLNLNEGIKPGISGRGFWLYAKDKPLIHLSERDGYQEAEQTGCFDHVAFQVMELESIINRLEQFGVKYKANYIHDISMSQIFFRDPSGIKIEVNSFIK